MSDFLVDANLPRTTGDLIRQYGHQATDVRDIGLATASDQDIADHAQQPTSGLCASGWRNRVIAMNSYETCAVVEDQGQVRVLGVPFAPGTEVEVTIKPAQNGGQATAAAASDRAARLFAALDKARNTESVGPLRRVDLYDRKVLR